MVLYMFESQCIERCEQCPMFNLDFSLCALSDERYVPYDREQGTYHIPDWCPLMRVDELNPALGYVEQPRIANAGNLAANPHDRF